MIKFKVFIAQSDVGLEGKMNKWLDEVPETTKVHQAAVGFSSREIGSLVVYTPGIEEKKEVPEIPEKKVSPIPVPSKGASLKKAKKGKK